MSWNGGTVMKWTQQQLFKIMNFPHHFQTGFDFSNRLTDELEILAISQAEVHGTIERIDFDKYELSMQVNVTITVECALTLLPTDYSMDFSCSDYYSFVPDESDDTVVLEKNTLDLEEITWGSILLEKPLRVVRDDAYEILERRGIVLEESVIDFEEEPKSPFISKKK